MDQTVSRLVYIVPEGKVGDGLCHSIAGWSGEGGLQQQNEGQRKAQRAMVSNARTRMRLHFALRASALNVY
jgi:hypothetical protein